VSAGEAPATAPAPPPHRVRGGASGPEHALLFDRRRDTVAAAILTVLTLVAFVMVAFRGHLTFIQSVDDRWLRIMADVRATPLTWLAKVFNVLGLVAVTLPVRIAVAGYLAWRRRWYHFSAFVAAIVVSEVLVGTVKTIYDRPRPPVHLALVSTSGASFPSGHAIAASVTVVAIVIALFPDGPTRFAWGAAAAVFAFVMALSRAYLAAHWLSDAMCGALLGTTVALDAALVVQEIWDVRLRRSIAAPPTPTGAAAGGGARGPGG
jgi:undecaprenyl-diphosphatase